MDQKKQSPHSSWLSWHPQLSEGQPLVGEQWFIEQIATVPPSLAQNNLPLAGIHPQGANSYMTLNVFCFILVKVAVLLSGDSIRLAGFFSEAWQHHHILSRFRWCEIYWQSFPQHILQVTHMGASALWQEDLVLALHRGFLWTLSSCQSLYSLCCFLYILFWIANNCVLCQVKRGRWNMQ